MISFNVEDSGGAMRRAFGVVVLSVACIISSCGKDQPASGDSRTVSPNTRSAAASPLVGEWDTGPYPADELREEMAAEGYSDAEIQEVLGNKKRYEVRLTFSEDIAVSVGWDPTTDAQPTGGDHGPYLLLPGNKLKTTCDVCDIDEQYTLYSYAIQGTTLTLQFVRDVNPDYSALDRHMSLAYAIANTSLPFKKIG
jgi:hypothetical protein